MSRLKDILLVFLTVVAGALFIMVWRQHGEIVRLLELSPASGAPKTKIVTVHRGSTRALAVPRVPEMQPPDAGDEENAARVTRPAAYARPSSSWRGTESPITRLLHNPDFMQALGLHRRSTLDARFADLFRRLELDPETLARFKHLLAEKDNVALEVVMLSETSSEGPLTPPVLRMSVQVAREDVEREIRDSLGEERYAIYRDYERTFAQRQTIAQLAQRLSYTPTPLQPAQAETLVRILAENPARDEAKGAVATAPLVVGAPAETPALLPAAAVAGQITDEVVAQAHAVLAPAQVDALRELQVEQQGTVRASEMMQGALETTDDWRNWGLYLLH